MKINRIVVGMLACLGMAAGLGAACPPEGDDVAKGGKAQHPECCSASGTFTIEGLEGLKGLKLDDHLKQLLGRIIQQHADPDAIQGHLHQLHQHLGPIVIEGQMELDDLNVDGYIHAALAQLHDHLNPDAIQAHLHAMGVDQDIEPVLAQLYAFAQPEKSKSKVRIVTKDSEKNSGNFVIAEDDNTFSITLENGEIKSLQRNGKKVDLKNVKKEGDSVKILGDDGKAVYEFELGESGVPAGGGAATFWVQGGAPGAGGYGQVMQAEPPKAMIGVQLGEPNGMLLGHFGLEAGEVTLVTGVYSGLPAAEAGLKPYDIIVSVDGKKPAGEAEVRDALRGKEDGDRVTLTVIHQGERKEVKLKLVKYDQEALEKSKLDAVQANVMGFSTGMGGGDNAFVAPGLGQLRRLEGQDAEQWRQFAEQWKKQAEDYAERFKNDPNWRGEFKMDFPPTPPPPGAGHGGVDRGQHSGGADWQRLEERLERLEKMIERLAERQAERNRGGAGGR